MAALQCELCGGKLIGKPGGIFECDHCGMEYSSDWAKAKIQEIQGTVKVEGTVQVEGTVKVEGSVNIESLLKRGQMALADKEWEKAAKFFDDALNINAECSDAYLGKYYALIHAVNAADILDGISTEQQAKKVLENPNFQKAVMFASSQAANDLHKRLKEIIKADLQQREIFKEKLAIIQKKIAPVQKMICTGSMCVGLRADGTVVAVGSNSSGQCNVDGWRDIVAICAGSHFIVGLCADGTVVAAGYNGDGQCNVDGWCDIVAIAAGNSHTVGLRSNGTVVATGDNRLGQCLVESWQDVVSIYANGPCTMGIRSDGTVVAAGEYYKDHPRNVKDWKNIVAVAAERNHTVGLKADGTVVADGWSQYKDLPDQCYVFDWEDIVAIAVEHNHTVGLKADGSVVVAGRDLLGNYEGDVENWRDIIALDTAGDKPVGLRLDGTVAGAGTNWKNIVAISVSNYFIAGLRSDGTVVTKDSKYGTDESEHQRVKEWKLFNSLDTIEQELEEAAERRQIEAERKAQEEAERKAKRTAELNSEKDALNSEYSNLKGLFTGKRRKEIEAKLREIDRELSNLK